MHLRTKIRTLGTAAAMMFVVGCSSGSALAPNPSTPRQHAHFLLGRIPVALDPMSILRVNLNSGHHFKSFNACPITGSLTYISDFNNSVINIYAGTFANQAPCGILTGLTNPQGMFVAGNHDLYVANTGANNILVFARHAATPKNTYTDPGIQYPTDVTVATDGTVIASNIFQPNGNEAGSISTWIGGPNGGTFVGNFPMVKDFEGLFVTVQRNGTLYFNDLDATTAQGIIWTGSCPSGACGAFTSTGATAGFSGGLRSADHEDLVQVDQTIPAGGGLITYESFPAGTSCAIGGGRPAALDLDRPQSHAYYSDITLNLGGEIAYPSCTAVGTVPGNPNGLPIGIAHDKPEPL